MNKQWPKQHIKSTLFLKSIVYYNIREPLDRGPRMRINSSSKPMTSRAARANQSVESSPCRLDWERFCFFFPVALLFCLPDGLVDTANERNVHRDGVSTASLAQNSFHKTGSKQYTRRRRKGRRATPGRSAAAVGGDLRTGVASQYNSHHQR